MTIKHAAAAALAMACLGEGAGPAGDYTTTGRQPGYYPKPAALGNLTAKRRAANKAARKARAKNRR